MLRTILRGALSGVVFREWRVGALAKPINKPGSRIVSLKVTIDLDADWLQ